MKKTGLILTGLVMVTMAFSQTKPLDKDISSVDGMVNAFYEIVSGPAGQKRDWDRDKTLYSPGITFTTVTTVNGSPVINTMTHDEFIEGSASLEQTGFFEKEIHRVTHTYGSIVQVWSTYEFRMTKDGAVVGRGINGIQLYHDGNRWWIKSAIWQSESDDVKIPSRYGG